MHPELSKITNNLSQYSEKNLSKFTKENRNDLENLVDNYIDVLTKKIELEEAKNILKESGNNILHITAKFGCTEQIKKILEFINNSVSRAKSNDSSPDSTIQSYVNLRDSIFFTPLHYAAKNGWTDIVKILIANGADINVKTSIKDREWMPIHYCAKNNHLEILKILLDSGVNKEAKTAFGLTPLIVAAEFGHLNLVKFLLTIGANKNAVTIEENHSMNALHYAAVGGFSDVVLELIKAGMNKEAVTNSDMTALYLAVSSGSSEVINVLLKNGAKSNVTSAAGYDILYLAASKGKKSVLSTLLKWGIGDLEKAEKIFKGSPENEITEELGRYKKAIKNLFALKNLPENFSQMLRSFTKQNLDENLITLENNVSFNAYGILGLRQEHGIFSKEKISLTQLAFKKGISDIFDQLTNLEKLTGLYKPDTSF
ncbi:MAG: ankyrin repeat domain-containing protein [Proteobacteria bacterium]|nr:ankyrin repeat domain-containing protein [Pseudomonadota bacterium]